MHVPDSAVDRVVNVSTKSPDTLTKLRRLIVGLTQMGSVRSEDRSIRRLAVGAAKLARTPGKIREAIDGMSAFEQAQQLEASTWLDHYEVASCKPGRFDACDLRNWIAIAERADVPFIPIRTIASFTSDEYGLLLGTYGLDRTNPRIARIFKLIENGVKIDYEGEDIAGQQRTAEVDIDNVTERLYGAMDDVPEGWMVRSHICGSDNLKSLAGCGVTETFIPEVRFGADLEIGPGWVRTGNRRRIDIQDKRTVQLYVHNDTVPISFLARPWIVASRWLEGRDPHRAGTPIDILGSWPAEWRAFVHDGKVTGVSAYYSWAGRVDSISAQKALDVRMLAQKIADAAIDCNQLPRDIDNVLARRNSQLQRAMEYAGFRENSFDCTLDFIEADGYDAGLLFLEAGPGCGMVSGGHPCGFAGDMTEVEFEGQTIKWMQCKGVAFRNMDHILIGEPKTWKPGDKDNAILDWDEVASIAASK